MTPDHRLLLAWVICLVGTIGSMGAVYFWARDRFYSASIILKIIAFLAFMAAALAIICTSVAGSGPFGDVGPF